MSPVVRRLVVHADDRGELLPIDLAEVGFPVVRIFVVTGPDAGAERGGHLVPCTQLLVLVTGRAVVEIGGAEVVLEVPGEAVELVSGGWISYVLDPRSSVLVLADAPYGGWPAS